MGEAAGDRVLTIPNAVTTFRLLCIPVFVWMLLGRHDRYPAAILLGVLGSTDWVDGYLARRLGQTSTVGKVLDPTVDRLLIGTAVISVLIDGSVPAPVAIVVLVREVLVFAAAAALAVAGARRIDVQWAGKAGTFSLMVALPLFLVGHSTANWRHVAEPAAWICAIVGICFGWYAAVTYVPVARRALAEGRAGRAAGATVTHP